MTQTTNKNAPAAATGRGGANNQQAAGIFAFNDTRSRHEVQYTADQERLHGRGDVAMTTTETLPKYQVGELVIPHNAEGQELSEPQPITEVLPPVNGVYYYRLPDSLTGLEEWRLRRPGEPWQTKPAGNGQKPTPKTNPKTDYPAAILSKLIAGQDLQALNIRLEDLPQPWGDLASAVLACPPIPTQRTKAFEAALAGRQDAASLRAAVFAADPAAKLPAMATLKTSWTVAELYETEFPEPKWAVPGIIPVGLSFLAGRPKVGKSFLGLQIACAVGTGGRALGEKVEQGKVLYLALEDSPRRLKKRLQDQGVPRTAAIEFRNMWKSIPEGGLVDLQTEIEQGGYSLVIIDTLSRALGRADQLDSAEMTAIIGHMQYLAIQNDIALLLIDHHRKSGGFEASPIDDILGSTAKAAVADAVIGLYREQGKHGATLKITGRDLEEKELALEWDALNCCWQSLGDANEVREESLKGNVLQAIKSLTDDGEIPTTTRIAAFLNMDKGNVSRTLADLVTAGRVRKGTKVGREQPYEVL